MAGLHFACRIDAVTTAFDGLPLLGFTRRAPQDVTGLHPQVSTCLGASVLVGTGGKAYARDQHEHFQMGFKLPASSEVQTWSLPRDATREWDRKLSVGDIIGCSYTLDGCMQFWLNQEKIMDFDTGRPIDGDEIYYAVVDVSFTVGTVTLVPDQMSLPKASFIDTRVALETVMSVGDLSTVVFDQAGLRSRSSSVSSSSSHETKLSDIENVSVELEAELEVEEQFGAKLSRPASYTQESFESAKLLNLAVSTLERNEVVCLDSKIQHSISVDLSGPDEDSDTPKDAVFKREAMTRGHVSLFVIDPRNSLDVTYASSSWYVAVGLFTGMFAGCFLLASRRLRQ
jgi:hypothetical protein